MPVEARDPYAPPPPHKDKSGRFVRYVIVAAILGAGAVGYMQFANSPQQAAILTPAEEQTVAENSFTTPEPAIAPQVSVPTATPAAPAPAQRAAPTPAPSEPVPAPTTTVGTPSAG